MRQRHKGAQFTPSELSTFLYAFGSDNPQLPSTISVLDEIIVDFIIETCHEAAQAASYSRRAKIKVEDFKFLLRRDPKKLGRVIELFEMEKHLKEQRKMIDDIDGAAVGGISVKEAREMAKSEGGDGDEDGKTEGGKSAVDGKGKRGRKKRKRDVEDDAGKENEAERSVRQSTAG